MVDKPSPIKRKQVRSSFIFVFLMVLLGVLGYLAASLMKEVNRASTEIEINWLPSATILGKINANTIEYRLSEMEHVLSLQTEQMQYYEARMDSVLNLLNSNRAEYEKLISSAEEKSLYERFSADWDNYLTVSRESIVLSRQNRNQEATSVLRQKSQQPFVRMSKTLDELIQLNVKSAREISQKSNRLNDNFLSGLIVILSLGGLALLLFVYDLFRADK